MAVTYSVRYTIHKAFTDSQIAWITPGSQPRIVRMTLSKKSVQYPTSMYTPSGGRRSATISFTRSAACKAWIDQDVQKTVNETVEPGAKVTGCKLKYSSLELALTFKIKSVPCYFSCLCLLEAGHDHHPSLE